MSYDPLPLSGSSYQLDESVLERIYAARKDEALRAAAFKTVDIFSGIVRKRLVLKNGFPPSTDLRTIQAPFDSPYFYQDVEHELSHILFRSDSTAKKLFIEEYTKRVGRLVAREGESLEPAQVAALQAAINHIIGVTEDHRCESLWSLIYRGSFKIMRKQAYACLDQALPKAHVGLCVFYSLIEAEHDPADGPLSRFRPYLEEALRKVEYRGFAATLVVSKWLLANLVSELIREMKNIPPPKPPERSKKGGKPGKNDGGNGLWDPPEVDATPKERVAALKKLLVLMGTVPDDLKDRSDDVKVPKFLDAGTSKKAAKAVSDALKLDIHNASKVNSCLNSSANQMNDILAEVFRFLRQRVTSDDWIRQGTEAKIVFRDVRKRDIEKRVPDPLLPEDLETVRRLRAIFHRIMGRRNSVLDDSGTGLDVGAYIERRATGVQVPVFRQEVRGRGFKCLIMLDRSYSMRGERTEQAERATKIIGRALRFPFVDMNMWGFQSLENGQIDITRFDPTLEIFDSLKSRVDGCTPLHLAVQVGVRRMERGSEAKHLIVTTDGFPVYTRRDGQYYPTTQLLAMVRSEVMRARKKGIQVTGVLIGNELAPKHMSYMFGRSWKYMSSEQLGASLVQLVSSSFLSYLRRG